MTIKTYVMAVMATTIAVAGCGGGDDSSQASSPQQQASKYDAVVVTNATASPAPVSNAKDRRNLAMYNNVRSFAYADLTSDGCTDMFVAPTYADHLPKLPVEIWVGDCKGGFTKSTSILSSTITTGAVNNIFIADFNGDGAMDVLLIDQGLEDKDATTPGFDGAQNQLLLSDGAGHLVAQPSTFMDNNGSFFNHLSAVGDLNGDGKIDLVLVRLGGPNFGTNAGAVVYYGDGAGHFAADTAKLPAEVSPPGNAFQAGGAAIADLDGDAVPEIVLANYTNPVQEVLVLKLNGSGTYDIVKRIPLTASLSNIGYDAATKASATGGRGLGASSITIGDFNGDGQKDVAVLWEGASKSYVQVLKNAGGLVFNDVTDTWLNGLTIDHSIAGGSGNVPVSRLSVADVDGNGVDDLVAESMSYSANDLATRSPYLVYGSAADQFKFQTVLDTTPTDFATFIKQTSVDAQVGLKVVDLNRDGKYDVLAVDWGQSGETVIDSGFSYFANTKFYAATAK